MPEPIAPTRLSTGIDGLDRVLSGGLPERGLYLLEGDAGCGKTTMALQFLRTGVARGEPTLLVAFSETLEELTTLVASHGWTLDGIEVMDLSDLRRIFGEAGEQTLFHPAEIEFGVVIERILGRMRELRPTRVVIDSLSELRHLAGEGTRYRLHMEALKPSLLEHASTVLLADGRIGGMTGFALHTLVHGVIALESLTPEFGPYRRRLRVQKLRNIRFMEGLHDFEIRTGGITVYPRLVLAEQRRSVEERQVGTGVAALDDVLAGGLDRGTSTLLMGPAGSGKSSLATQMALASTRRGEKAAIYLFDERLPVLLERSRGLGMELSPLIADGWLIVRQVDPLELSPGKFAHLVRTAVEAGTATVIIDSLTGYMASMGDEPSLMLQLRNLLSYLGEQAVTTILVSVQHGLVGPGEAPTGQVSYLADTVILLRFYEYRGAVHRAVSALKRRAGGHEPSIRDIAFGPAGIVVGPPLRQFRGVLSGLPASQPEAGAP
ncbi:MAG: ATPase domain-containing protein [Geminicoccaceae bacterium]